MTSDMTSDMTTRRYSQVANGGSERQDQGMSAPKGMTAIDSGIEDGIEWATVNAALYGAVNGYARIPDGHPWHGLGYGEIEEFLDWDNELTYGRDGWIGFDTLHAGDGWPGAPWVEDSDTHWTAEMVADVARSLARQVAALAHV